MKKMFFLDDYYVSYLNIILYSWGCAVGNWNSLVAYISVEVLFALVGNTTILPVFTT
jgi:hypothetical protein